MLIADNLTRQIAGRPQTHIRHPRLKKRVAFKPPTPFAWLRKAFKTQWGEAHFDWSPRHAVKRQISRCSAQLSSGSGQHQAIDRYGHGSAGIAAITAGYAVLSSAARLVARRLKVQ